MSDVIQKVECFMLRHQWFCRISMTTISALVTSAICAYCLVEVML